MEFLRRFGRRSGRKVFVIGLDCAAPELVFHRWRKDLPNLTYLADQGLWGELQSSIPAITVPAWSSMLSSRDPGVLGIYGFRNRADHSYDRMFIATGATVKEKRVWDYLTEADRSSVIIGVPQTYPVQPLKGYLVSGFLTPGIEKQWSYPANFKEDVLSIAPNYAFDVHKFRTEDKDWLLDQIQTMTEQRFDLVDHLLTEKTWDFFMLMEIGVDRIHHGFWSYHDPSHRRYAPGNPYENAIHDYYVYIDRRVGEWLDLIDKDTVVMVVSDHGAKRMDGGVCVNEWLWREGYLALKEDPIPNRLTPIEKVEVEWESTKAWGAGGYYGRIFLNVRGREPEGTVDLNEYERVRDELSDKITDMPDPAGNLLGTRVFKPSEIYLEVNGIAPDLLVYFGDLFWRSVGSFGHGGAHTFENDMGPDDCNHAENGMFILFDPTQPGHGREIQGAELMDIAPSILKLMGVDVPKEMQGKILWER